MCAVSQDVMDKLSTTVKQFLDQGRMFTAYDVTIETRQREKMMLRHSEVNGACHEVEALVDAMDYGHDEPGGKTTRWTRTRRDVPGGNGAWAWVYHPDYADANSYQFSNPNQKQPKPAMPAAVAALGSHVAVCPQPVNSIGIVNDGNTSDSGGEQDDGTFAVDFRSRLMIPTRFMRDAGISAGDECYVIAEAKSNSVLVTKADPGLTGVSFTVQKVEKDGELRLSSRTLRSADLTDTKFVIETADKTLGSTKVKVVEVKKSN